MINLAEVGNLAMLSDADRNEIERNKSAFRLAKTMLARMAPQQIRTELSLIDDEAEREALRYALNSMRTRR